MKKHRRLEARKRVDETLTQTTEIHSNLGRQALEIHLEGLEKEFSTYNQMDKQRITNKRITVS